jgi:thiamine pyrophosphate-dependent acetolactate synthase large subunit-like protein
MLRSRAAWDERIALAETLGTPVLTDHRLPAAFPNQHELHLGLASMPSPAVVEAIARADLLLDLGGLDRDGLLRLRPAGAAAPTIVAASLDHHLVRGGSVDLAAPSLCDLALACAPEELVSALLREITRSGDAPAQRPSVRAARHAAQPAAGSRPLNRADILHLLRELADPATVTLVRTPTGWPLGDWPIDDPLSHLGGDGGAGLASGPGLAVGAALALRGSGRRAVAVLGDGDFLMGASALWTAAHYRIPLLVVVADNRCFGNDVMHQAAVASRRGRDVANARIGQDLGNPAVDIPGLARALGAYVPDAADHHDGLRAALTAALSAVAAGRVAVVDALIDDARNPAA